MTKTTMLGLQQCLKVFLENKKLRSKLTTTTMYCAGIIIDKSTPLAFLLSYSLRNLSLLMSVFSFTNLLNHGTGFTTYPGRPIPLAKSISIFKLLIACSESVLVWLLLDGNLRKSSLDRADNTSVSVSTLFVKTNSEEKK